MCPGVFLCLPVALAVADAVEEWASVLILKSYKASAYVSDAFFSLYLIKNAL